MPSDVPSSWHLPTMRRTGTVERVGERQTLVRLTAPVPGMLSVFAYSEGDGKATAGVRAYLFSADAAEYVRREQPSASRGGET